MEKTTFTRQELYDLVWSTPMTTLAKKYLISDSGLRKKCKKMNIPSPLRGHWEKLRAGKKVVIKKLLIEYSGEQETSFDLRQECYDSKNSIQSEQYFLKLEIENDSNILLEVPERLVNPDEFVRQAKQAIEGLNKSNDLYDGLIRNSEGLNVAVTPINLSRALRFMNTLIKAMRIRNHQIENKNDELIFIINKEEFKIRLREKLKRVEVEGKYSWDRSRLQPTGIFILSADGWIRSNLTWEDRNRPIENQLSNIIASLEIKSKEVAEERKRIEIHWAKEREKEKLVKEHKQLIEKEKSDFYELLQQAKRWKEADLIRDYIKDKEIVAIESNSLTEDFKNWKTWANKKADWYDPTIDFEDELLGGYDVGKQILP